MMVSENNLKNQLQAEEKSYIADFIKCTYLPTSYRLQLWVSFYLGSITRDALLVVRYKIKTGNRYPVQN
jgi:hypothetical protein